MPRLPRIVIPELAHHVTQRGNRRQRTFFCDDDYNSYITMISQSCRSYGVTVFAYCLMPNHVHLIVVPQEKDSLRFAIGEAHEKYTKQINFRNNWKGHLWQGRFFSTPLDEEYLVKCVRYVELNPVRAGICQNPFDYKWSSALAHLVKSDDKLVSVQPMLMRVPNWVEYLKVQEDNNDINKIRKNSQTGRPIGSEAFLKELEKVTNLSILKKKPGPKPLNLE